MFTMYFMKIYMWGDIQYHTQKLVEVSQCTVQDF